MKYILCFTVYLCLTACGVHFSGHNERSASLCYSIENSEGWSLFQHARGEWKSRSYLPYLQQYFSVSNMIDIDRGLTRNTFLAEYALSGTKVIVYVATGGYEPYQGVATDFFDNVLFKNSYDNSEICKKLQVERITVAFNAVDVEFKSDSVKFKRNGKIIQGEEIVSYFNGALVKAETYPSGIYNLATLKDVRRFEPTDADKNFNHPTFTYRFNMTCADLENSIFIIDGLYYKGKQIPPLRVRLNYYDFSKVPQYEGEPSTRDGNEVARP